MLFFYVATCKNRDIAHKCNVKEKKVETKENDFRCVKIENFIKVNIHTGKSLIL